MAVLYGSGYEGTIPNDDVVSLATMLIGFDECDPVSRSVIESGWVESWKLMDYIEPKIEGLDFNSAAAVEYPAFSPYFGRIQGTNKHQLSYRLGCGAPSSSVGTCWKTGPSLEQPPKKQPGSGTLDTDTIVLECYSRF